MSAIFVPLAPILSVLVSFSPHPHDKDGWGLRVRPHISDPYLEGESLGRSSFHILIINFSKETRELDPLAVAIRTGDLTVLIKNPDGKPKPSFGGAPFPRDPFTQPEKLRPGGWATCDYRFSQFGYDTVQLPGRYRVEIALRVGERTAKAAPFEVEVVKIVPDAVLMTQSVPLEGRYAAQPLDEQYRVMIQQVKVGSRIYLVYRRLPGTKYTDVGSNCCRIAELDSKTEMKVEGAFGARNPLTITYKDPNAMTGVTKLVINSIDGTPWTEEDERARQERLNPKKDVLPPPKPVKP